MEPAEPKQVEIYVAANGDAPYEKWYSKLRDRRTRAVIANRINRIRLGNLGCTRTVGDGVFELKIDYGPGYRVSFADATSTIILLLGGGDKSSQSSDIKEAKRSWKDYKDRSEPI